MSRMNTAQEPLYFTFVKSKSLKRNVEGSPVLKKNVILQFSGVKNAKQTNGMCSATVQDGGLQLFY